MIVNQKQLAQCLGISTRQVRNLRQEGMFQTVNGDRGYILETCIQEYINFKINAEMGRSASISKEEVQAQHEEVKKLIDSHNEEIRKIIDEQNEKISGSVSGIQEPFDKLKGDLNDKIHTENVKCYRNIQTLFEESDKKLDLVKSEVSDLMAVKGYLKVVSAVAIVNLVGVIVLILRTFGLF